MKQTVNRMAVLLAAVVFSALCGMVQAAGLSFSPGSVSTFATESSKTGTVVGVSGLQWSNFDSTDDYGTKAFIHADVVDAEKTAAWDDDNYWCGPLSDMDALFITGWARATSYATVDTMANYFRRNPNLLRFIDKTKDPVDENPNEGTYGYAGFFNAETNWFKKTTRIDLAPYTTNGVFGGKADTKAALTSLFANGEVVRLAVFFTNNVNKSIWKGVPVSHAVLCVGYEADGATGDMTGLFIIDPDNDQCASAGGGEKAPNSIAYCPVVWNNTPIGDYYNIPAGYDVTGIWGGASRLLPDFYALEVPLAIDTEDSYSATHDGDFALDVSNAVRSVTKATISVSGLPAGLKYDAKAGKISGKAAKPGKSTVKVSAYNTLVKKALAKTFELTVPNFTNQMLNADCGLSMVGYTLNAGIAPDIKDVIEKIVVTNGYKLAIAGLPAGVTYDKNANALKGVATKEGDYTVTFTATKTQPSAVKHVATTTFSVVFPKLTLMADVAVVDPASTNGVKLVGEGKYPYGKKVALRATPAKGNVFVGWYDVAVELSKSASYQYTTTNAAKTLTAKFATAEEDAQSLNLVLPPEYKYEEYVDTNGTFKLPLGVPTSLTPATLTVAGLPAGLTYKAKDGAISGKTTKAGAFAVKVSGRNTSVTKAKVLDEFVLRVANVTNDWSVAANLESTNDYQLVAGDVASVSNALTTVVSNLKATGYTNVSFAGLPPGVTYNANTGTFKGVATKEGYFNVTISVKKAGGKTETATTTFFVDYPELTLSAVDSGDPASTNGVKLVGAGKYQSGKKVALRATPVKGGVFAGWYDAGANLLSKTAAYQYTTADVATNITAKFATAAEDAANLAIVGLGAEYSYETVAAADPATNGTFHLAVNVTSLTPATVAVAGLPAGLKYDAKAEEIVGKKTAATKPGAYVVKVTARNTSERKGVVQETLIRVANVTNDWSVAANLESTNDYVFAAGAINTNLNTVVSNLTAAGYAVTVSGLPAGVTWDARNKVIKGVATKEGYYTVTFTATKDGKKETATATVQVVYPKLTITAAPQTVGLDASVVAGMPATSKFVVRGAGSYAADKKVSLGATAPADWVFAGWFTNAACTNVLESAAADYRTAVQQYVTGDEDVTLYAAFVHKSQDFLGLSNDGVQMLVTNNCHLSYWVHEGDTVTNDIGTIVESVSFPTITASGLPAGLKFDAKKLTLSGKITAKPGYYYATFKARNVSGYTYTAPVKFVVRESGSSSDPMSDEIMTIATGTYSNKVGECIWCKPISWGFFRKGFSVGEPIGGLDSLLTSLGYADGPEYWVEDIAMRVNCIYGNVGVQSISGIPTGVRTDPWSNSGDRFKFSESTPEVALSNAGYDYYGTPTVAGWFTFNATDKNWNAVSNKFVIGKANFKYAVADEESEYVFLKVAEGKGTVTGGGVWNAGKYYTITARPGRGEVFAGWFIDPNCTTNAYNWTWQTDDYFVDFRLASQKFMVTSLPDDGTGTKAVTTLYAKFIDSTNLVANTVTNLGVVDCEEVNLWDVTTHFWTNKFASASWDGVNKIWSLTRVDGEVKEADLAFRIGGDNTALPTVSFKGLPAGFYADKKTFADGLLGIDVEDSVAKAGTYPVTMTIKDAKGTRTEKFTIKIEECTIPGAE